MAWALAVEGGLLLADFIYHRWIEDKPPPLKPGAASVPQTEEGSVVPLLYGTCRVRAPVLAWIGNWNAEEIGSDPVDHFIYFVNTLWVVGVPFYQGTAAFVGLYASDRKLNIEPRGAPVGVDVIYDTPGRTRFFTHDPPDSTVNQQFFGGPGRGGVISGEVTFYDGRTAQLISDGVNHNDRTLDKTEIQAFMTGDVYIGVSHPSNIFTFSVVDAALIPSYRNMALCFLEFGGAETPVTVSYSFEVTALSTGSTSDLGRSLALDADPAAVIIDLLTSPWGKLALPLSKIDMVSFNAASLTLFGEGHGYSRAFEQTDDSMTIINDILKQTDGVLYEEPTTGLIEYHLVRADYTVGSLTDINPDNAQLTNYQVQGWSETINQVRLTYTSRQNNYNDAPVIAQNPANVTYQGGKLRSADVRYAGCSTPELARALASRELGATSTPIVKATVTVDRTFYQARPGQAFTFTWPELNTDRMVMRCARVNLGQLHKGAITIDLIRDIFSATLGAFPSA